MVACGSDLKQIHQQMTVDATTTTVRTADVLLVRLAGRSSSGSTVLTQYSDAGLEVIHKLDMGVLKCKMMERGCRIHVIQCSDLFVRKVIFKVKI